MESLGISHVRQSYTWLSNHHPSKRTRPTAALPPFGPHRPQPLLAAGISLILLLADAEARMILSRVAALKPGEGDQAGRSAREELFWW